MRRYETATMYHVYLMVYLLKIVCGVDGVPYFCRFPNYKLLL